MESEEWQQYRKQYEEKLRKLLFPDHFVDQNVVHAFMFPAVDCSLEPFQWSEYSAEKMQLFLRNHPSVNESRIQNSIKPALKNQKKEVQLQYLLHFSEQ